MTTSRSGLRRLGSGSAINDAADSDTQSINKGVVSLLQEYVQCSRLFHAPQHRPILQWTFDNRLIDSSTLEFRATVAFLLDGIPHHVAGAWHPSKKMSQRDAAERALIFFVGCWGEQLIEQKHNNKRPTNNQMTGDVQALESYCRNYSACCGAAPLWTHTWEAGSCRAQVELSILGVMHKLAGRPQPTETAAERDTARRVLWYLQCPGYETLFAPDPRSPAVADKDIPSPPANWASDEAEGCALLMAERKTMLMRVQNRLQQEFAKELKPGQSVWEWSFEMDENDTEWPPKFQATVSVPVMDMSFVGEWMRGQREAQIEACHLVSQFLNEHLPSKVSSDRTSKKASSGQNDRKPAKVGRMPEHRLEFGGINNPHDAVLAPCDRRRTPTSTPVQPIGAEQPTMMCNHGH